VDGAKTHTTLAKGSIKVSEMKLYKEKDGPLTPSHFPAHSSASQMDTAKEPLHESESRFAGGERVIKRLLFSDGRMHEIAILPRAVKEAKGPMTHVEKWFYLAESYQKWAWAKPKSAEFPTEYQVLEQSLVLEAIDTAILDAMDWSDKDASLARMRHVAHALNWYRRVLKRRRPLGGQVGRGAPGVSV
jgi:hypothetical protein